MIAGHETVLAIIPARGGSRGVLRKNVRLLAGKPLIAWSICAAQACPAIDRLIVSSEDDEIMAVARDWGCEVPFRRPAALATDQASSIDVLLHALDTLKASQQHYDWLLLLQPTSPLRLAEDIETALRLCVDEKAAVSAVVSLVAAAHPPQWSYYLDHGTIRPVMAGPVIPRRQDLPQAYTLNGAVFVARTDWLRQQRSFLTPESRGFVMPPERSIDIDSELDFALAELLLQSTPPSGRS
ncbi:MAG: acylneuraminate cytidylyltransferase family protein [Magnetococcales bacterium]|nr:acylneuraminate cytidylyltransferase family protein [Magnetococcales bacterium]